MMKEERPSPISKGGLADADEIGARARLSSPDTMLQSVHLRKQTVSSRLHACLSFMSRFV